MPSLPTWLISRSTFSVWSGGLDGHRQHHHVELVVSEHAQPGLDVALDHVDAAAHAGQHRLVVDLHAVAGAAAGSLQPGHQRTVAAAEVQHPRAGRDPAADHRQVGPQRAVHRPRAGRDKSGRRGRQRLRHRRRAPDLRCRLHAAASCGADPGDAASAPATQRAWMRSK